MIHWLGQLPTLPGLPDPLPPKPADWPVGVPFPPSPKSDGTAPVGWPAARKWPPDVPAGWPPYLTWPNPPPPPAPPGWAGPWPLAPPCWPVDARGEPILWPPPAPGLWVQTRLPWPPVPTDQFGFVEQFRTLVPWWPANCPVLIPQPTTAPPVPTVLPPADPAAPPVRETPRLTTPQPPVVAPAPAPTAAAPSLSDALKNPVVVILLRLAVVRTVASVVRSGR